MSKRSRRQATTIPATGANPAYVQKMQAIRFSGAAGVHKQAKRPNRGQDRRASINQSRYS